MADIRIRQEIPRVEALFEPYKEVIGDDYPGYRNHVYRTITYAMHFLDYQANYEQMVETAFVYHDIGLWTDHELAYLEPSEAVALADNEKHGWGLDPETLRNAIHWHHKISPYRGRDAKIVEACRKADWIDASKGFFTKGLTREQIRQVEAAFPNNGFHQTLLRLASDYGGSMLTGGLKVTFGIVKF